MIADVRHKENMRLLSGSYFQLAILVLSLFGASVFASQPTRIDALFHIVAISEADQQYALAHLQAGPSAILLSENVKDLDQALKLVGQSLNFVPPKRAGQYGDWILFPRLDVAKDDDTFLSGFAIQIGKRVLQRWGQKE